MNIIIHLLGDSIRLTPSAKASSPYKFGKEKKRLSEGDEYNDETIGASSYIEGIVLDRRAKHLDICIKSADAIGIRYNEDYRMDCFVNRVSYDRMLNSLQLLSQQPSDPTVKLISKPLKDIIMYSYPNSILRLSKSSGGLRLALPFINESISQIVPPNITINTIQDEKSEIISISNESIPATGESLLTVAEALKSNLLMNGELIEVK